MENNKCSIFDLSEEEIEIMKRKEDDLKLQMIQKSLFELMVNIQYNRNIEMHNQ